MINDYHNYLSQVRDLTAATPAYRYVDLRGVDTDYLLNVRVDSKGPSMNDVHKT